MQRPVKKSMRDGFGGSLGIFLLATQLELLKVQHGGSFGAQSLKNFGFVSAFLL